MSEDSELRGFEVPVGSIAKKNPPAPAFDRREHPHRRVRGHRPIQNDSIALGLFSNSAEGGTWFLHWRKKKKTPPVLASGCGQGRSVFRNARGSDSTRLLRQAVRRENTGLVEPPASASRVHKPRKMKHGTALRLRELRTAKGLTQEALGALAGMRYQVVAKLERGAHEPKWATVLTLADALSVDVSAFRKGE